ncbi:winged helix DNA-binding domain-containing protein [Streptomyces sp. NPDC087440]|uniref:winged helix DNA-binding domain-containing protein n=1 Tax=Streptomyces sp. NPDC087440 TaxID=3365790 RepID=UPI0038073BAD
MTGSSPAQASPSLTWRQVCDRRLAAHRLDVPAGPDALAEVAGAMCGVHAQVMSAAELSLGVRTASGTREDVRRALWEDRTLVKTYGPRGTVHLFPVGELALWTGALGAVPAAGGGLPQAARLDPEQTEAVVAAVGEALRDAELTVDELSEAVIGACGDWAGDKVVPGFTDLWPRWRQAVHTAAHRGVLCFGPMRGRKVTYTGPGRWVPGFVPAAPGAALAEVVRHYLRAYGPASPQHFAQWLSAPKKWAADLFASLAAELREVRVEGAAPGETLWELAGAPAAGEGAAAPGLHLLPYFDAYVIGSHPRPLVFPGPEAAERALARGQAGPVQVLVSGGTVAGIWHQKRSGKRLDITVEAFGELPPGGREELARRAERIGEVLQTKPPTLAFGAVTAGKHL